jgi:tRNA(Ile)-lysidine synthase
MRGAAHPDRLRFAVLEAVREHALWGRGDRVAVAVSGGRDSIALLDLLLATQRAHGARLEVVTVDHRSRPGSGDDAAFVWGECRARGVPVTRVDGPPGPATEAAWRELRYAAFERLRVDRVALAHHADDLAETVLLQLVRGVPGACAPMAWRRGRYVRPLLGCGRDAIAAYAASRGLAWREDPTNADRRYLRARIRHEVLPLLEDLRPGAASAIAAVARADRG